MTKGPEPAGAVEPRSTAGRMLDQARGLHKVRFVRETAIMQGGMIVTLVTYLLTSVVLARALGPHEFGRYTIAFQLYTFIFFIGNLGITTNSVSRYAKACGKNDETEKIATLAAYLRVFLLMCLAIVAIGALLPSIGATFYDDRALGGFAWLLCLLGPAEMMNGFMLVVQQGARRPSEYVLYDNSCGVVRLVMILFAMAYAPTLEAVVVAYLLSGVVYWAFGMRLYALARREARPEAMPPPLARVVAAIPSAETKGLFTNSALIAIGKNGAGMFRTFAFLLIGNEAGNAGTAHFRVAFFYIWAVQQLLGGLQRSVLPALGFRIGKSGNDPGKFRHDLFRVCLVSGFLFIALTVVACLLAPLAVHVLYGPRYANAVPFIYVLALGHLVVGFSVVSDAFYIYTHQIALSARINISLLVFLTGFAALMVHFYGALGGAIVFSVAQLLGAMHLIVMYRYFRRPPERLGRDSEDESDAGDTLSV